MTHNGDQAEAQRTEIYRSEVHRADVHRADVHRADVHRADVRRAAEADAPEEFLWEGEVHRVRAVLTHQPTQKHQPTQSHHSTQIHQSTQANRNTAVPAGKVEASPGEAGADELWRVCASAGRHGYRGVFDLRFDWTAGRWTVTRIPTLEAEL